MPPTLGFLSTYPPTQCGLATFTSSLRAELVGAGWTCGVVRVLDRNEPLTGLDVVAHLVAGRVPRVQAAQVQLMRPPLLVMPAGDRFGRERALRFVAHTDVNLLLTG